MNITDHWEAGHRVFPLWQIESDGSCGCGNPDCNMAGKHPRNSSWQNTPDWSDEQFENMSKYMVTTGYGVLAAGMLVVDVDKKNGGFESLEKLDAALGFSVEDAGQYVVSTGGGGLHIYFSIDPPTAMVTVHRDYPGIDFKSSGYLVGSGSTHASGATYERKRGFPQDVGPAPDSLVALLAKKDSTRASVGGGQYLDVTDADISELLSYVSADCGYDDWIKAGMAVHDATGGSGIELWDSWSKDGQTYPGYEQIDRHWQSFGKCSSPATLGTLIHFAEAGGWKQDITFDELPEGFAEPSVDVLQHEYETPRGQLGHPVDISGIDLRRPPGFVGELTKWINSNSIKPRENIAPLAALQAVGCIGSLRYQDDTTGATSNIFAMMIADSGTGKNAVEESYLEIMDASGLSAAVYGTIKSDTELVRNLIRHQAAFYQIGEIGIFLGKIKAGAKSTPYLAGLIGVLIDIYSKTKSTYSLSGDVKEEAKSKLLGEIGKIQNAIQNNEIPAERRQAVERDVEDLKKAVMDMDKGLKRPCLSLLGATTPVTFDAMVDYEQATNGFIGRCVIAREANNAPARKKGYGGQVGLPSMMRARLFSIHSPGCSEMEQTRISYTGDRHSVPSTADAVEELHQIMDWEDQAAKHHEITTGLQAIASRVYECTAKLSLILAIPDGLRTVEHVRWAYKMARRDMEAKIEMAQNTMLEESKEADDIKQVLINKILQKCRDSDGVSMSLVAKAAGRKFQRSDVESMVAELIKAGRLQEVTKEQSSTGQKYKRLRTVDG